MNNFTLDINEPNTRKTTKHPIKFNIRAKIKVYKLFALPQVLAKMTFNLTSPYI